MDPLILVDNLESFHELMRELRDARFVALDTESNSFHAYYERICLIQISVSGKDYVIDPFMFEKEDLSPFGEILADARIEKIMHAASNDVLGLKRDYHFQIHNLFDTSTACRLLNHRRLGLARILEKFYDVKLDKRWQRHNWGRRPLNPRQIEYARMDTHYLIPLRHELALQLHKNQVWESASKAFQKICEQESRERNFEENGFMRLVGARSLDPMGAGVLKELYLFRDREARRKDRSPFRIIPDNVLVKIAQQRPMDAQELHDIKGFPRPYRKESHTRDILRMIAQAKPNTRKAASR